MGVQRKTLPLLSTLSLISMVFFGGFFFYPFFFLVQDLCLGSVFAVIVRSIHLSLNGETSRKIPVSRF